MFLHLSKAGWPLSSFSHLLLFHKRLTCIQEKKGELFTRTSKSVLRHNEQSPVQHQLHTCGWCMKYKGGRDVWRVPCQYRHPSFPHTFVRKTLQRDEGSHTRTSSASWLTSSPYDWWLWSHASVTDVQGTMCVPWSPPSLENFARTSHTHLPSLMVIPSCIPSSYGSDRVLTLQANSYKNQLLKHVKSPRSHNLWSVVHLRHLRMERCFIAFWSAAQHAGDLDSNIVLSKITHVRMVKPHPLPFTIKTTVTLLQSDIIVMEWHRIGNTICQSICFGYYII